MSRRGPAPLPTAVKKARGTDQPCRRARNEPKPARARPACPAYLRREAKEAWRGIVPELHRLGLLTRLDREVLVAFCDAWADFRQAGRIVRKEGLVTQTDKGNWIQHPAVSIKNSAAERLRKLGQEFGLTPSARTKLEVEDVPQEGPKSAARFFAIPGGRT